MRIVHNLMKARTLTYTCSVTNRQGIKCCNKACIRIHIYCVCNKLCNRMPQIKINLTSWTLFIVFEFLKAQCFITASVCLQASKNLVRRFRLNHWTETEPVSNYDSSEILKNKIHFYNSHINTEICKQIAILSSANLLLGR
jgi:hypothetical protein